MDQSVVISNTWGLFSSFYTFNLEKKTSLKIFIIRLQIKASEIVLSNSYKAGMTLRFPRVQRIREDRAWDSCMTLSEVIEMRKYASGKLATRHCSFTGITLERLFWFCNSLIFIYFGVIEDTPASKRIKLAGLTAVVAAPFQSADTSDVKKSSSCFSKKEICVLNGSDSLTKQELERKIVSGGGTVVQNPGK
jgi:DNA ligase-4